MRAVLPYDPVHAGAPPALGEVPDPVAGPGEVRLAVRATAVNRADLLQLAGAYPPPPGESPVPGLECAGVIEAVGEGVTLWRVGDSVMALLGGGGHAERVAVPAGQLLRLPPGWSFAQGAALPEAAITSWVNLVVEGRLVPGETVLVTGAAGGIGSFAVQLARELGATVIAAGRSRARLEALRPLGARFLCEPSPGFGAAVREATGGRGVDLVLDFVGGAQLSGLLEVMAPGGRVVLLGLLAGTTAEVDLACLLRQRVTLLGSTLRSRSRAEKGALVAAFAEFAFPRLSDGRLRAVVDRSVPFGRIAEAYAEASRGRAFGKIVVELDAG
jgi:putative PIG3 family NAD(P)H quinone oxidoreductase